MGNFKSKIKQTKTYEKYKPMEVIINNKTYYNIDEVRDIFPGTNSFTSRKLISFLRIPSEEYIFAYLKKDIWVISNDNYSKAKVLVTKKWIDSKKGGDDVNLIDVPKLSIDGKELNIEIRAIGMLSIDNIIFRVKDIANEFNMPRLKDTLTNKHSSYVENFDYKKININSSNQYLYLTYTGFLRFIFVSRGSKVVTEIQQWASKIIYGCQFGNQDERINIVKTILPEYSNIVCDIFSKFEFPCIYLLGIGSYMEYSNVYKFGYTIDFNRRYKEHSKKYKTIPTVCILQYIDSDYLSKAELEIKNYMTDINAILSVDGHDELVILSDKQVKSVMNIYKNISHTYSTHTNVLQTQIDDLKHQMELLVRDNEINLLKERHMNEILQKNYDILEKNNEILKLQLYK